MTDICGELHELFNARTIHTFPFDKSTIPRNGIYVLFENGQKAHDTKRIVRIGTHTGDAQLGKRLRQHFLRENKDRSIFRKNIGRAMLNRRDDSFLEQWNFALTSHKNREKYARLVDFDYQQEIEEKVSAYIQQNLSFSVFEVPTREERLHLESRLISTISLCEGCGPSPGWLGSHSPKRKIRQSGLWQIQELWKVPFTEEDFAQFRRPLAAR
jgi:hypothetical protein